MAFRERARASHTLGRLLIVFAATATFGTAMVVGSGGCASEPTVVPSSGPRPPSSAAQVRIFEKEPERYELLGTVTVTRAEGAKWDQRGNADAAFDAALAKAAALGANGLLLSAKPGESDYHATAGYHGKFYQVPVRGKQGDAVGVMQAIYVLKE
jgi:hypothetical protein